MTSPGPEIWPVFVRGKQQMQGPYGAPLCPGHMYGKKETFAPTYLTVVRKKGKGSKGVHKGVHAYDGSNLEEPECRPLWDTAMSWARRGKFPYINQGKGDTLAHKSHYAPPPQHHRTERACVDPDPDLKGYWKLPAPE
eukprot:1147022-Pelagomonas_calceolata.AAC.3